MKLLPPHLAYLLSVRETRQNVVSLIRYVAFTAAVMGVYTVLFHIIMLHVEGQDHSWLTGFYWTLTVMSTLGFGDITFHTDIGRLFSILVLVTGIVQLLIVLPFAFVRLFFGPWLEAQVRLSAPTTVPPDVTGHVLLCAQDAIAPGLGRRLRLNSIPYFFLEPDPVVAGRLHADGQPVVAGEIDASETYERARAAHARLLLANREDTVNTNVILTAHEVAPELPILATANEEDSIDILELAGAAEVLALKKRLGEMLVHRINTGHAQSHVIGRFHDLLVAEFGVHGTGFAGKTVRETRLGEAIGVNVIGIWDHGEILPAQPSTVLSDRHVLVVLGTRAQLDELDLLLVIYDTNYNPAVVIGGGKVGHAAVREFERREFPVHVVEREASARRSLEKEATAVFIGDAADRNVLIEAGIDRAPAVLLTTSDDAMNIYLALYCRRLNPDLRIVSRITHERNVEAIHRAGADFVLSYASLGVGLVMANLRGGELLLLGEKVELCAVRIPRSMVGCELGETRIRDDFGLNVIALESASGRTTNPRADIVLPEDGELILLGSADQRERFFDRYQRS